MKILLPVILLLVASCSSFKTPVKGVRPASKKFYIGWIKNNDPAHKTGNLPIALNSPAISDGIVFAGHNSGFMIAYELDSGRLIWKKKDNSGHHSYPVNHKDNVIYGTVNGRVYSRDSLTGKLNYSIDLGSSIDAPGVIVQGRILFHLRNHRIICLDVETGKVLWNYKRSVPYTTTLQRTSTPLVINNNIYIGFADGYVASLSLEEGIVNWETRVGLGSKFVDVDSSPVIFSGQIVSASPTGKLTILNKKSGSIIQRLPYMSGRTPYTHKGQLIVGTNSGELVFLDSKWNEIKRKKITKSSISSLIYFKGKFVIATLDGHIISIDENSLNIEKELFLGHSSSAVFGKIAVEDGKMVVLSSRNRLYMFNL